MQVRKLRYLPLCLVFSSGLSAQDDVRPIILTADGGVYVPTQNVLSANYMNKRIFFKTENGDFGSAGVEMLSPDFYRIIVPRYVDLSTSEVRLYYLNNKKYFRVEINYQKLIKPCYENFSFEKTIEYNFKKKISIFAIDLSNCGTIQRDDISPGITVTLRN